MATSKIGTLCDSLAAMIEAAVIPTVPIEPEVKSVRRPFLEFSQSVARVYVFPVSTQSNFEVRKVAVDREVRVAVTVVRQLTEGTEAAQVAEQDQLLQLVEAIEALIMSQGRRFSGTNVEWGLTQIDAIGGREPMDDQALDQDNRFQATLQVEYLELAS